MRTILIATFATALGIMPLFPRAAYPQSIAPATWSDLRQMCRSAQLNSENTDEIIQRCQEQGVPVSEAHAMLSPGCEAAAKGLPAEPVMEKIREGLAKGIAPEPIASAARRRVGHLIEAAEIAESTDPKLRVDAVIVPAARAMESGLEPAVITSVMGTGRGGSAKELAAAFEACEALYLAGFSSDDTGRIVEDCLNRNLRRVELRRVVRYASQQRRRGMETLRIRQSLWGNGVEESQRQSRHKEQHGQGPQGGQGPGGPGHGGGHGNP
jgi:hypothetical protein